jgi:hypothetical protein
MNATVTSHGHRLFPSIEMTKDANYETGVSCREQSLLSILGICCPGMHLLFSENLRVVVRRVRYRSIPSGKIITYPSTVAKSRRARAVHHFTLSNLADGFHFPLSSVEI